MERKRQILIEKYSSGVTIKWTDVLMGANYSDTELKALGNGRTRRGLRRLKNVFESAPVTTEISDKPLNSEIDQALSVQK